LSEAELNGEEVKVKRRLQILIRTHEQKQHFQRLKQILKPKEAGGLSYILVPENFKIEQYPYEPSSIQAWEPVHDQDDVQLFIQKRNILHFGQAKGTPFTEKPLSYINWQANSTEAKDILKGAIPLSFLNGNPYVEQILRYMAERKNLPEIDTYITPDHVSKGFRKWRESTSTSPSGCHLGLRRISSYTYEDPEVEEARRQILQVQTDVINIPIQNGFSPTRWQTVVNAMLEKYQGSLFYINSASFIS
jgi:hypothetical protein